jgi:hypothetical protein
MVNYKTPGVYIEEINTFPPGVAAVETAIPAFIGYTQKAEKDGTKLFDDSGSTTKIVPTKIKTLLDYEAYFGKEISAGIDVYLGSGDTEVRRTEVRPGYLMYQCIRHYFDNGGGECFIVVVGLQNSTASVDLNDFLSGLEAIKKVEDPTLLLAPDAVNLSEAADLGALQQQLLMQSKTKQDRFAILDVKHDYTKNKFDDAEIEVFRQNVGANNLEYGAAYYPYLKTVYSPEVNITNIQVKDSGGTDVDFSSVITNTNVILELEKVMDDLSESADLNQLINRPYDYPSGSTFMDSPLDADPYLVSILNGYEVITKGTSPAAKRTELENRVKYVKGILQSFIHLTDSNLNDTDASASITINDKAKSAEAIHDELVDVDGKLKSVIMRLIAIDEGHPSVPADLADPIGSFGGDDLGIVSNNTTDFDIGGLDYDTDLNNALPNMGAFIENTYGIDPATATYDEAVNAARGVLNQLYNEVLNTILDFRAQLEKRLESLDLMMMNLNPLYASIKQASSKTRYVLPPSAAVAGLYAMTDNNRGVWKAPANVSVNSVIGPTVMIDSDDQKDMNVDTNAGKSVNAIRAFRGKGTIVWGGRTLLGNDDNWRYVNVRRLFIFLEISVKRAMDKFVFEPNTANTWVLVQSTIENFLTTVWRQGGLAGATAEDAFRVDVGLGKTMSTDDVNKGFLIVDVSVAPSRPAEFIVLRFSQKLQVS